MTIGFEPLTYWLFSALLTPQTLSKREDYVICDLVFYYDLGLEIIFCRIKEKVIPMNRSSNARNGCLVDTKCLVMLTSIQFVNYY